jgi:hypothetical protein
MNKSLLKSMGHAVPHIFACPRTLRKGVSTDFGIINDSNKNAYNRRRMS